MMGPKVISKYLLILALVLGASQAAGITLSKECDKYCNRNRPVTTNAQYSLFCNKTTNRAVCKNVCKNECPREVCLEVGWDGYYWFFRDHHYVINCPGGPKLPSFYSLAWGLALAIFSLGQILLYGGIHYACIVYEWWEQRKLEWLQLDVDILYENDADLDCSRSRSTAGVTNLAQERRKYWGTEEAFIRCAAEADLRKRNLTH